MLRSVGSRPRLMMHAKLPAARIIAPRSNPSPRGEGVRATTPRRDGGANDKRSELAICLNFAHHLLFSSAQGEAPAEQSFASIAAHMSYTCRRRFTCQHWTH